MSKEPQKALDAEESAADEDDGESKNFKAYFEYNRVLRTWFVAFGVGGPALFLVNDEVAKRLSQARDLHLVVVLFLLGALAQVLGALLNKVANWYVYLGSADEDFQKTCRYHIADCLIDQFWIDVVLDVGTIATFGCAAWLMLSVFAKNA